mmetsp:Transcript_25528/g.22688  ORF Transcript_25528/g.22688 Transcript_25528/m.22688 type:complete len:274 (-) Transcript_25528:148-969(-)
MCLEIAKSLLLSLSLSCDIFPSSIEYLINLISDYDTGTYEMEGVKDFMEGFYAKRLNLSLTNGTKIVKEVLEINVDETIKLGKRIQEKSDAIVEILLTNIDILELTKVKLEEVLQPEYLESVKTMCEESKTEFEKLNFLVFAVDSMEFPQYRTKIGTKLNKRSDKHFLPPITLVIRKNKETVGEHVLSFRSDDPRVDCSKIANYYGGGGHKQAASFRVLTSELSKMIVIRKHPLSDIFKYWNKTKKNLSEMNFNSPIFNMHLLMSVNQHNWTG